MRNSHLKTELKHAREKALHEGLRPFISFFTLCQIMERDTYLLNLIKRAGIALKDERRRRREAEEIILDLQNQLRKYEENTGEAAFYSVSIGYRISAVEDEALQRDLAEMLNKDNQKMRKAGNRLAIAATRVIDTYDGIHRLSLELREWFTVIAEEGNRDRFKPL